jgi:predicted nucleotidyltransferase
MELELQQDFKELFRSLNENEVKYLLIGGYAVVIYGYVRNTNDIDIAVSNDPKNAEKLVRALTEFGFAESALSKELFLQKDSLVRMGVEPNKIEILNYLDGLDFENAYKRRKNLQVEDIEISVISLEDLIANKKTVGRLKDLADIEELEQRN